MGDISTAIDTKVSNSPGENVEGEPCPLVIVEGFFGTAGPLLWGNFEEHLNANRQGEKAGKRRRRAIFASVGPVSSLHDRACELYYAIKGGVVDYGEQHSSVHEHNRFGRDRGAGLYPQWTKERPLHFLGHSIGGSTIVKLQDMMKQGCFPGAHPDMILSINSISSPFRGTQLVYTLGERADAAPAVRPLSIGSALSKSVHLLSYISPILPSWLDFHADSRSLTFRDTSVVDLVRQLWRSDWAESRDATPFDVTFLAAEEREDAGEGRTGGGTWYRSVVTCWTRKSGTDPATYAPPLASSILFSPLYLCSRIMSSFDFALLKPIPSFVNIDGGAESSKIEDIELGRSPHPEQQSIERLDEDSYRANDGVVPLFSQWHPLSCSPTHCRHTETPSPAHIGNNNTIPQPPQPGIWHVQTIYDTNHLSVVPLWYGSEKQVKFWRELGDWLDAVDGCWIVRE